MRKKTIWLEDLEEKNESKLKESINADILIIGGGITGISSAYFLKEQKLKIVLVERNKMFHGVTSKTTAKLNYLQGITYTKIKKTYNEDIAKLYLESQKEAIQIVKKIIKEENIECDFEKVISKAVSTKKKKELKKEYSFLKNQNINVEEFEKNNMYSIQVSDTYVFHPLKYLSKLIDKSKEKNISFFENTNIIKIKKERNNYIAFTEDNYQIKANKIILACHYPFFLFPFFLPIKTYIEKSYIRANLVNKNEHFTMITTEPNILSERFLKSKGETYKITLTNSHKIDSRWNENKNFDALKSIEPSYYWSNEDIMTYDNLPFIGELKENLYLATGYNTWGMTNGTLGGCIISDLVLNRENKYQHIFDPKRKNAGKKLIQYPINIISNTKSFIGNKLIKQKKWYPENLVFKKENGTLIAVYTKEKKEYIVTPTCPHMGCTLLFNEVEHTWDCPCHASRFDINGKCIKGPSKYNITYKK